MRKLLISSFFPYHHSTKKHYKNQMMLGIGGNVGDCIKRFENLFLQIQKHCGFCIISTSPIYQNPAFGFEEQEDFFNATMQISTNYSIVEVFRIIFYWERRFGRPRKRAFKNAPRTLDIDLLWFNDTKLNYPHLQLPHPHWGTRESTLIPLGLQTLQ